MDADVVVVGAGIAGLAAAESLLSQGRRVLTLEASPRAGGLLATTREDGWLLEHGANGWLSDGADLMGLADWLRVPCVPADGAARRRYVVKDGRPVPLPRGPLGLLATPLLPFPARLRVLRERRVAPAEGEESVAAFAARRFGPATADLADAAVTGVFAGDPAALSLDHAFPRVRAMERDHGSVLKGLARARPRPMLVAPREGMAALVEALARRVAPRTGEPVLSIRPRAGGFRVETAGGAFEARGVVLAMGPAAGALLGMPWPAPRTAPVAVVGLGYDVSDVRYEGFGLLAPESAGRFVLGAVNESAVFPGRAPPGRALLRVLVGGVRHPERAALPDDDLARRAAADLADLGYATGKPVWTRIVRPRPIPQIEVGHGKLLEEAARAEATHVGLAVTGAGLRSVAVKDLVADARAAADRVNRALA